jgi:hypothetical protein
MDVWGSRWNTSFAGDKVSGLDYFHSHVGGTPYARTNSEYYDNSGNVNTTSISKLSDLSDYSATSCPVTFARAERPWLWPRLEGACGSQPGSPSRSENVHAHLSEFSAPFWFVPGVELRIGQHLAELGNVTVGTQSWKIQGNWSNAAALAKSSYTNVGCIQTS